MTRKQALFEVKFLIEGSEEDSQMGKLYDRICSGKPVRLSFTDKDYLGYFYESQNLTIAQKKALDFLLK